MNGMMMFENLLMLFWVMAITWLTLSNRERLNEMARLRAEIWTLSQDSLPVGQRLLSEYEQGEEE